MGLFFLLRIRRFDELVNHVPGAHHSEDHRRPVEQSVSTAAFQMDRHPIVLLEELLFLGDLIDLAARGAADAPPG